LKIHADLPDATALVGELQSFKADFTDTGYIKFNARSGAHDDLVLALGVALWRAYGDDQHTGILEYYKRAAGTWRLYRRVSRVQKACSDEEPTSHHDASDDYGTIHKRE
jgi:hypothetical protein